MSSLSRASKVAPPQSSRSYTLRRRQSSQFCPSGIPPRSAPFDNLLHQARIWSGPVPAHDDGETDAEDEDGEVVHDDGEEGEVLDGGVDEEAELGRELRDEGEHGRDEAWGHGVVLDADRGRLSRF